MFLIHAPYIYHKYTLTHTTHTHAGHTHTGALTRLSLNVYDLMASSHIFKKCGEGVQTLPDTCGTRTPFIERASDFTGAALDGYVF